MSDRDGSKQRVFAVHSGRILKAVCAQSSFDAACQALLQVAQEMPDCPIQYWELGINIHVAEEGCSLEDSGFFVTKRILNEAGFEDFELAIETRHRRPVWTNA